MDNLDNIENCSPEMIAQSIFTQDPKSPCSHQILAHSEGSDLTYVFEILITILLEGLNILTGDIREADLSIFNSNHIMSLLPWFQSVGFDVKVSEHEIFDKESYKEYYCRTRINNDSNKTFFIMKDMEEKPYHFLINGQFYEKNKGKTNLADIYGVFDANSKIYAISFDFHIPA
jgi:hypothetical protein